MVKVHETRLAFLRMIMAMIDVGFVAFFIYQSGLEVSIRWPPMHHLKEVFLLF